MNKVIRLISVTFAMTTVIAFWLTSCTESVRNDTGTATLIEFDPENTDESLLSDLKISFYQPETNDSSLIGSVGVIREINGKIFVSDRSENKLLVFEGEKYAARVGSNGNGPGEQLWICAYFKDPKNSNIAIWDWELNKLSFFNDKDYKLVKEKSLPHIQSNYCQPLGENILWNNISYEQGDTDHYFLVTDADGNIIASMVDKQFKSGYITGSDAPIYILDGNTYGFTPYDMTIYQFADTIARPVYKIAIKGLETPSVEFLNSISENGESPDIFKGLKESQYIRYYDVTESPTTMHVTAIAGDNRLNGFYRKSDGRLVMVTKDRLEEILGLGKIRYFVSDRMGNDVVAILDPATLKEMQEEGYQFSKELTEYLNNSNEDSNPIFARIGF